MKKNFSLDEIENWKKFQHYVGDYFELGKGHSVDRSGIGPDEGKDILITSSLRDAVISFQRKWVVQCKFYEDAVRLRDISTVNIPTLTHRYGATGYLLVCKKEVHNQVREFFKGLRAECKMGYAYEIWDGSELYNSLLMLPSGPFFQKHHPEYQEFLLEQEEKERRLLAAEFLKNYQEDGTV